MDKLFCLFALSLGFNAAAEQKLTVNIYNRVLHIQHVYTNRLTLTNLAGTVSTNIQVNTNRATAFTIEVDDRQYLITAAHVVPKPFDGALISVFHEQQWKLMHFNVIPCAPDIDILVLVPPFQLTVTFPVGRLGVPGLALSQEMYFVGFPFGMFMDNMPNVPIPLPFVKSGICSGMQPGKFWIDGMNNPGFSGGPAVFWDSDHKLFRIAGVVSGYRLSEDRVIFPRLVDPETGLVALGNSGLVLCSALDLAVDAIRSGQLALSSTNRDSPSSALRSTEQECPAELINSFLGVIRRQLRGDFPSTPSGPRDPLDP